MENIRRKKLLKLAKKQYGYFTAKQALAAGFLRKNLARYCVSEGIIFVEKGLYRFPMQKESLLSEFARLSLWSRDCREKIQAIISHQSALQFHGMLDSSSDHLFFLSVPLRFRKNTPLGCRLFKRELSGIEYTDYGIFKVTTATQTILDMEKGLRRENRLDEVLRCGMTRGLIRQEDIEKQGLWINSKVPSDFLNSENQMHGKMYREGLSYRSRTGIHAFSLVELLVVISIISILASLLLPILGKVKSQARGLACGNNLKQIGTAGDLYISDNRGYLPYSEPSNIAINWLFGPCTDETSRKNTLCPYLEHPLYPSMYNYPPAPVSRCPEGGKDGTTNPNKSTGMPNTSYSCNYFLIRAEHTYFRKPMLAKRPSNRLYFCDSTSSAAGISSSGGMPLRHTGADNFLFLDQHLEKWKEAKIVDIPAFTTSGYDGFWHDLTP
jgi:prepilin-type N-terminal cleavage/methylation domain-containing protein